MYRNPWLDVARLIAIMLVAAQHALSVCGTDPPCIFFDLDPGQLGVAIFFSISGFLAIQGTATPLSWLAKRLNKILPPYWIAVTAVLIANQFYGYKPTSASLVISEYLGTAGWTHRGELIGVHFWFISLLLFCYVIATGFRRFPSLLPVMVTLCIGWLWYDSHYAGHTLAFLTGAVLGKRTMLLSLLTLFTVSVCSFVLASLVHPGFARVAVCAITLSSLSIRLQISNQVKFELVQASNLSYHFYLVHGPIYLAVARLFSPSLVVVVFVGTFGSVVGTISLAQVESLVRKLTSGSNRFLLHD